MNQHYKLALATDEAATPEYANRGVEATLALAHEQHTANLLDFARLHTSSDEERRTMTAIIRDRLGLPKDRFL